MTWRIMRVMTCIKKKIPVMFSSTRNRKRRSKSFSTERIACTARPCLINSCTLFISTISPSLWNLHDDPVPELALSALRVILYRTRFMEDHCRSAFKVICGPVRQYTGIGVAMLREHNPGAMHTVGQWLARRRVARKHLHTLLMQIIPDKRNFQSVARA